MANARQKQLTRIETKHSTNMHGLAGDHQGDNCSLVPLTPRPMPAAHDGSSLYFIVPFLHPYTVPDARGGYTILTS
jgi:hypothetical protein